MSIGTTGTDGRKAGRISGYEKKVSQNGFARFFRGVGVFVLPERNRNEYGACRRGRGFGNDGTGASVRYKEDEEVNRSGIRFSAYISENYKNENPEAQYGMLLCPADLLGENELTAETENAVNKITEVWSEENDKEGYAKFTTVLYNIPESEYGQNDSGACVYQKR